MTAPTQQQAPRRLPSTPCSRFRVSCYRMIAEGMSVPDEWITGQSRESAEYHAWRGRKQERREVGCYHGPFLIIPENTEARQPATENKHGN